MADRITELRVERRQYFPRPAEPGVLYVSEPSRCAMHLCPCGCGHEVITPFWAPGNGPVWQLSGDATTVTLSPSILCRSACASHYYIRDNQILWC